ncbi:endonuclease/exonuclease/phosphatase family protein [Phytoactinopolyspora halophila]|uniref:endonuclease/exonuclease/phosphatase family protein n=1 Tax=Phytoactinopolyspora halophila TaxID=1981511 RepID=UPI001B8C6E6D|nr:endonuclease/exonuclease/phosphatase family protein [Phytoactinopolyspora halophila]
MAYGCVEIPDSRGIRVGFVSRHPLTLVADVASFPDTLAELQADDSGAVTTRMGRGALAVRIEPAAELSLTLVTCHFKSKLLTFPGGRFSPRDEGERARYAAYALYRRAAEAVTVRDLANQLIDGRGQDHPIIVLGDLNDEPQAATTQILLGPPGSEFGTGGFNRPDQGDAWRLWNLAPLLPADQQYSRVYRGRGELIDHILVNQTLLDRIEQVRSIEARPLPSIEGNPNQRRNEPVSDHALVLAKLSVD